MAKIGWIVSLLLVIAALTRPPHGMIRAITQTSTLGDNPNPFSVDPASIKKEQYKWTMKLINKNAQTPSVGANPPIKEAAVTIESLDKNVLHVKIVDMNAQRWEAPIVNPKSGQQYVKEPMDNMGFEFNNDPFSFKVTDPTNKETVVDSSTAQGGTLQFMDKYLEIGLWYSSRRIYGLGERTTEDFELCTQRDECVYTLWGKDSACPFDDGGGGGKGAYGQQPFYMVQFMKDKRFMGVLSLNSNDQDANLRKVDPNAMLVKHKMIGGVFDLYFFYSGTAEFIMQKYHELVGRPYIAPFWALGYHQCRYGWRTLDKVKDVLAKFEEYDIPLDVLWADIDYMKDYADFTVDPVRFAGMKDFVDSLHTRKIRYVPIIDAGLKYDINDKYYKMAEANNALIKSAVTKKTLIGRVWPGPAVFLSWYAPMAKEVWFTGLSDLYDLFQFDGIWLDMNEIANFCHGECPPGAQEEQEAQAKRMLRRFYTDPDPHDPKEFDDLPYRPGGDPTDKAVSLTGYHYHSTDFEDRVRKEYNTHSLWALYEAMVTHQFFVEKLNRRPFVLTRANFPGSGIFTSKWLGDNHSRWEYMRYAIVGLYNFQMYGMPLVGADMCGFMSDTTEELCARWMQAGSFYPFTRNHNDIHSRDQEPYIFGERVAAASRNAIRQKYSILWYYYTKLYEVSLFGGSMMRPLFWEFPYDQGAFEKTKFMWMIGSAILIPPVLHEGLTDTYPYCPNEHWFNLRTFTQVYTYKPGRQDGEQIVLPGGWDYMNVLLRGGSIIPYQDALTAKVRRSEMLFTLSTELIVAPDHNGNAAGTWVVDDGDSLDPIEKKAYRYLRFNFDMPNKKLQVTVLNDYNAKPKGCEEFFKLTVFGAESWANVKSACISTKDGKKISVSGFYDSQKKLVTISKMNSDIFWKDIESVQFDSTC